MACVILLLLSGLEIGWPQPATAHDLFTAYIQHSVRLSVGARHVDCVVDLTFFEEWSARERHAMDADADGRITHPELESYLKKLAPELPKQVKLRVAGHEVLLTPLYDPELDLLGNDKAIPGHHRLRLFFFAPTPATLRANDEFVIEDRLWPDAKVLATPQAEGCDGCTLTTEISLEAGFAPTRPDETRWFKFRCTKPPANAAAAKTASATSRIPSAQPRLQPQHLPTPSTQTVP